MAGGYTGFMTGVWWDLHSCPVPASFDPGCVRQSIELALISSFGHRSITIFAVGNLDDISHDMLEKISSSGILLRHAPCGAVEVSHLISDEWKSRISSSAQIMLISSNPLWFTTRFDYLRGGPIIRAYDGPPPNFPYCPTLKVFGWESLLKASYPSYLITDYQSREKFPAYLCYMCSYTSQNFDDFIEHLKSEEHMEEESILASYSQLYVCSCLTIDTVVSKFDPMWMCIWFAVKQYLDLVESDEFNNDRPVHFCVICKYPAYNSLIMDIHIRSEVHGRKLELAIAGPSEEKSLTKSTRSDETDETKRTVDLASQ